MLEIRLLGTFDVRLDGKPVEVPSRPAQSLLAYLMLNPGTRIRREKLAGMFWPESDEANARSYLRHALWRLRKALGDSAFVADKVTIGFNHEVDFSVDVFKLDMETDKAADVDTLVESVSIYGGELLPGFYESWVVLERERLRAVLDQKFQSLLEALVAQRRWGEVLEWGERWIALGDVPEPAYRALMIANSGLGDSAGMAAAYRRCIDALQAELGVEPSEQTQELFAQLSKGEMPVKAYQVAAPAVEADASSAIRTLLQGWRGKGVETLDLPSLAIVHAARREVTFEPDEVDLLIRSALNHEVDIEPWLRRARSQEHAVSALERMYQSYPKPRIRRRIVQALSTLESTSAQNVLMEVIEKEDNPEIRAEAAVAAARSGNHRQAVEILLRDVNERNDTGAFAAFVTVVDEVGLPEEVGEYPKLTTRFALVQRRWRANRAFILRRMLRGALGGAIGLAIHGSATPLYMFLSYPETINEIMGVMSLPAWVFSGMVAGVVVGALQGAATTFFVNLADVLWRESDQPKRRYIFGAIAGLFHSLYLILFSFMGLLSPVATPSIYVPVNLLYGLLVGLILSISVPKFGKAAYPKNQLSASIRSAVLLAIVTIPYVFIIYLHEAVASMLSRLVYAFLLPLGVGIALIDRRDQEEEYLSTS